MPLPIDPSTGVLVNRARILSTDPVDWLLDENMDLVIPLQHVTGVQAVVQAIRIRLYMIRGEWFLDLDEGMPWFAQEDGSVTDAEAILGEHFSDAKLRAAVRQAITGVPQVVSIEDLQVEYDAQTRAASVTFEVTTSFGDTVADSLKLEP